MGPDRASELSELAHQAAPGTTILLDDGVYRLGGRTVFITQPGVTIRSSSGRREAVVLDGEDYRSATGIEIRTRGVVLADLTIRRVRHHLVHVAGGGDDAVLHNLHLFDAGQQLIKINPSVAGELNDRGTLSCSRLELTLEGRAWVEQHPV